MGFRRELVLNGMKNYGNDKRKVTNKLNFFYIINKILNGMIY